MVFSFVNQRRSSQRTLLSVHPPLVAAPVEKKLWVSAPLLPRQRTPSSTDDLQGLNLAGCPIREASDDGSVIPQYAPFSRLERRVGMAELSRQCCDIQIKFDFSVFCSYEDCKNDRVIRFALRGVCRRRLRARRSGTT